MVKEALAESLDIAISGGSAFKFQLENNSIYFSKVLGTEFSYLYNESAEDEEKKEAQEPERVQISV